MLRWIWVASFLTTMLCGSYAQINTDRVLSIGKNALYFEDYVLAIQYFNQVIRVKPHLAEPYFYRGVAKISLEDYKGAEEDCSLALSRNPFLVEAYRCRGIAKVYLKNMMRQQRILIKDWSFRLRVNCCYYAKDTLPWRKRL